MTEIIRIPYENCILKQCEKPLEFISEKMKRRGGEINDFAEIYAPID